MYNFIGSESRERKVLRHDDHDDDDYSKHAMIL